MFSYHHSKLRNERLQKGACRCASDGEVHQLEALLKNGRIVDPHEPDNNLSTREVFKSFPKPPPPEGDQSLTFIFAVNEAFAICVAPDGHRPTQGTVKHETLFHNADVLAAGEIWIRDGIIVGLNDHSGSYGTVGWLEATPEFATAVLQAFQTNNFPVDGVLLEELKQLAIA